MAASMIGRLSKHLTKIEGCCLKTQVRTSFLTNDVFRSNEPSYDTQKSWKQRKEEIEKAGQNQDMVVNIGLVSNVKTNRVSRKFMRQLKTERNLEELERKSRLNQLEVPIKKVTEEDFEGQGQQRIHTLTAHYGIFKDLFGNAYFYPSLDLHVGYPIDGEESMVNPVFYGNKFPPEEVSQQPHFEFKAEPGKFYTLCMTAPDSHLTNNHQEYLHWMVCNIPGESVDKGETICNYLPIFPVHGTGHHRYVFILYQHDKPVDFSSQVQISDSTSLEERTFKTLKFYRNNQEHITPVGICFFQAEWDESVRNVFHNVLDMNEPRFEFLPPAEVVPKQELWPIREPFNV
ncbi:large ribosomal subunit protein mL38-like [Ruditapes philippinarum]|uniref:large ribosomal subunit protein mL38-like n=1 Tax=Ruditapes philippinarum TaxID=129788 RepID=UPI00295A7BF6|nr:large ribosomal subunit protein mL38-like [Ruditapes philippinarum]